MCETATIEKDSVWFPRHKSAGTYIKVEEVDVDSDAVTVVRFSRGNEPQPMTIRASTLLSRYEEETA